VRVYWLDVTYPPGSHPSQPDYDPDGWVPESVIAEWQAFEASTESEGRADGWSPEPKSFHPSYWRWPAVRATLTRRAAERRADLLRGLGATVEVVASEPVRWPEAAS